MRRMKSIIVVLLMSTIFLGCTGSRNNYKDLSACNVELLKDETSNNLGEYHKIYKITIPAKTSISLKSLFIKKSSLISDTEMKPVFSENEFTLIGPITTTQLISITGNDNIDKKYTLVKGEKSYGTSEDETLKFEEFIARYDMKNKEVQRTGIINSSDIYNETNENIEFINYPYFGESSGISFYLTNSTSFPQEVYYNLYLKNTSLDIMKDQFGEVSNGEDKVINYLVTTLTDIYFHKDSGFYIN